MHLNRTKNEHILDQLQQLVEHPERPYCIKGAHRRFPLSTYLKKKYRGRIGSFLCDELHEYNNDSGQGDAMAELYFSMRARNTTMACIACGICSRSSLIRSST